MKNKITLLLCAAMLSVQVYAQKISADKVPDAVVNAFKAKFPQVANPEWEIEHDKNYEAGFRQNDKKHSVVFDASGTWIESETEMKKSDLPESVTTSISKEFPGFEVEEADQVESSIHGNCYEVEIEKDKENIELILSANGTVISKAGGTEDDGDDE